MQSSNTAFLALVVVSEPTIPVGSSIQAAANAAHPSDTVFLAAGTYQERITVKSSGRAEAPITIRGVGMGKTTLLGTIRVEGAFINIEDLTVNANGSNNDAIDITAPAHNVNVQRVHLHNGTGYGVRVGSDVFQVRIEACAINDFHAGTRDAHGIGIMTARQVTVRGCDISDTSGDAIQINTPDYPGYSRAAEEIRIEQNQLHETRENALDIKSTHGLVAQGNRIWGFRVSENSDGMAIQVQYDARNITLIDNQIWSAVEGIEVSRGSKNGTAYPLAPSDVLIDGNLIHDLVPDPAGDRANGSGIVVLSSNAVRLYNNTVLAVPGSGIYVGSSQNGDDPQRLDIRNNVLDGHDDLTFVVSPSSISELVVDYNHYVTGQISTKSLDSWLGAGYEHHATSGPPKLGDDMLPLNGSPLRDSGTDVGQPFQGAAPDRGWGEQ